MNSDVDDDGVTFTNEQGFKGFFHQKLFTITGFWQQYVIIDLKVFLGVGHEQAQQIFDRLYQFYNQVENLENIIEDKINEFE
jgi:hypothetical protein